ncbi:MAG: hypothetical protein B0D92_03270 [Spirochaeta sp. LUC14_002_19_P3]|nr:MAG: hypothetical protein B0D92_03270 [Spirochaeta sp. LUC14_002_19_P3]
MGFTLSIGTLGSCQWAIIPFGLFLGLLGYRMYKIALLVIGLFIGIVIGTWIGIQTEGSGLNLLLSLIIGLTVGIVTLLLFRFSLFLIGFTAGFAAVSLILPKTGLAADQAGALGWTAAAALAGGLLALIFHKLIILFIIALIGTSMIYLGTIHYLPEETMKWSWILYAALLSVFIIVQVGALKSHPDPLEREKRIRGIS